MTFDWKNLLDKAWWTSKTIWFNTIFTAFGSFIIFVEPLVNMLPDATAVTIMGYLMVVQAVGNKILRFLTKHGLIPSKDLKAQAMDVAAIEEAVGEDISPQNLIDLKAAAAEIKRKRELDKALALIEAEKKRQAAVQAA